ncbi:MAG TPA: alpha/beta hydrolase [Candidatus Acidoferrales bacterium]|jgi:haloacetate dehalogenase|nr:alpha/beta hydrolase [Candidatus Acidoferrales bacterium]
MSDPDRREFLKNSIALALAPASGNARIAPGLLGEPAPAQQARAEFFEGFQREQIKTSGTTINTIYGGNEKGSPLLLLHGIPETHVLWRKVAPALAQDYFLVMTDLRGYGDSGKPPGGGGDHFAYSKRAMAQDQVEVMKHLGFETFALVGHDRGGRAAHRLALDHPEVLTKLVILDIVPTYLLYQQITQEFATIFYHWFLLVQPPPFPETMVANSAEYFLKCTLLWLGGNKITDPLPDWIEPAAFQEYFRTFHDPATIHAICEDYRAAASIDLAHDKADLDKKIQCPLLVLWSEKGPFHRMYNVLQTWRDRAVQAQGKALPTGHFLPEQMPQEVTQELKAFLRS